MTDLPPEFEAIAFLYEAQPSQVRTAFNYCLCVMMVEAGKMSLAEILPGETTPIHVFQTISGDTYSVQRPPMTKEAEAVVIEELRGILKDEGHL